MKSEQVDVKNLIQSAEKDPDVLAVSLFGSVARSEDSVLSDVDVCLYLINRPYTGLELSQKKLEYLTRFNFDMQIFQQLPIYIRKRVLKEGKILFCRDEDELYQIAYRAIREFNDFEPFYRDYLREVMNG